MFRLRFWIRLTAVIIAAVLIKSASSGPVTTTQNASTTTDRATALSRSIRVGRLDQPDLKESSGLVASRKYPGTYWSMNDSGHKPMLFAVDSKGKGIGCIGLTGARNIDWEDIAIDTDGVLYIGDFGNNSRKRKVLTIYSVGEPDPKTKSKTVPVKAKYHFGYPAGHGPFDCEAMFVRKGWAYLITKEKPKARLYRVRLDPVLSAKGKTIRAEYLGLLPNAQWVTAADICPAGRLIAVLSYLGVWVYQLDKPIEDLVADAKSTTQPAATTRTDAATRPVRAIRIIQVKPLRRSVMLNQAEAVCWQAGLSPKAILITNEQRQVYRMELIFPSARRPSRSR